MTEPQAPDYRALLKRSLVAIEQLEAKLAAVERARVEPIAIVGIGCRFPGGVINPATYWELLMGGVDAVTEVPRERWDANAVFDPDPDAVGKSYTRWGGFLSDADAFDARFFGISRREAVSLDPQQRLLLEVTWEALEHAAIAPSSIAGSRTAVYVGISTHDYAGMLAAAVGPTGGDAYVGSGTAHSVAAGRISYFFGLHGPSMAIDTACSSSLVAVHAAVQSLRNQEATLAIAGGINLTLSEVGSVLTSRARMMASDGRCKTFDASADGYVRAEGCGILVLKRLSDAQRDGDRILACVRGSALNQDGRSSGLTAPNGVAQEAVIRDALANARLAPSDVSLIEAHGTGTALGDPIEVNALGRVFGGRDPDRPLLIGSVKTNIGHTESAAGVAGVIKAVLALQHRVVPPHLHFQTPNPLIAWDTLPIRVPIDAIPWESPSGAPRRAGVSSFGFSGTNAHVVIEEALPPPAVPRPAVPVEPGQGSVVAGEDAPRLLVLSAQTPTALRQHADRFRAYLDGPDAATWRDVVFTAGHGRSHLPVRLALVADGGTRASELLGAFVGDEAGAGVAVGAVASGAAPEVAFLFTGQGAQAFGMSRELYDTQPVFRRALEACAALADPLLERPLLSVMMLDDTLRHLLDDTAYTQPALFAVEYALAQLWRSWGVEPAVLMGHSVGEYVAACLAGVFSVEDGVRLIARRGHLMSRLPRDGGMATVFADEQRVREALHGFERDVAVAAVNGPAHTVISGRTLAVEAILSALTTAGVAWQRLNVSHAFHSPLIDPMLDEFERFAATVPFSAPSVALVSNVTGRMAGVEIATAAYWRRHARDAVRFADGIATLGAEKFTTFVEVGPSPTLLRMAQQCAGLDSACWLPSLRKGLGDTASMLDSLGRLYVRGQRINWPALAGGARRVNLPTYPFERQRYWYTAAPGSRHTAPDTIQQGLHGDHPLGSEPVHPDWLFEVEWHEVTPARPASGPGGRWLILGDGGPLTTALAVRLEQGGATVTIARHGRAFRACANGWELDMADRVQYRRLFADAALADARPWRGIVSLLGVERRHAPSIEALDPLRAAHAGRIAPWLAAMPVVADSGAQLWLVTRAAQPVAGSAIDLAEAPAWGLGGVVAAEYPELRTVRIDLDPAERGDEADLLAAALHAADGEDRIAFRGGRRYVARLVPGTLTDASAGRGPAVRPDATYLITGGLGGLGLACARGLADEGARHLVLVGRRAPLGGAQQTIAELEADGVSVTVAAVDIAIGADVAALLEHIRTTLPPLRGILHAAGVVDDALLAEQDLTRFERVMAPKVRGTWHLHTLTEAVPLDFFVMFSSAAALLGSPGQSNYAAANSFMDAVAVVRRMQGRPALSINWGSWADVGMAAEIGEQHRRRWARQGLGLIRPADGIRMLLDVLRGDAAPNVAILALHRARLSRSLGPFFDRIVAADLATGEGATGPDDVVERLAAASAVDRHALVTTFLTDQLARILAMERGARPRTDQSLMELGMDSLMAMELRTRVQSALTVRLSIADLLSGPTIDELAATVLAQELVGASSAPIGGGDGATLEEGSL